MEYILFGILIGVISIILAKLDEVRLSLLRIECHLERLDQWEVSESIPHSTDEGGAIHKLNSKLRLVKNDE